MGIFGRRENNEMAEPTNEKEVEVEVKTIIIEQGEIGGWTWKRKDKITEWEKAFTLSGSAENLDLNIGWPVLVERVEVFANDATSKSYTVRISSGTSGSYAVVGKFTGDIEQSNYVEMTEQWNYIQMPILIRIVVSASTAGKILTVKIQTRDL